LSGYWDEAYRSGLYRKQWDHGDASQEIATCAALGIFPRNGVILDVGCGSGSDAVFLATMGFQVKALDISAKALDLVEEKAAKAGVKVETVHSSATKMPIEDASIDFALDRGLLHNLSDTEGSTYALELARVLKQGGQLLLRGARKSEFNQGGADINFNPITEERIERTFPSELFAKGSVIPITMISDAETDPTLEGAIVIIRRK